MFSYLSSPLLQTFAVGCSKPTLLGLVPWYQYLPIGTDTTGTCSVKFPTTSTGILGAHSPFLLIGLAIIDDLIRVAALVAVGYVMWGGMQYILSQGSSDRTKKAQGSIVNALVGLALAIIAASLVSYLGDRLGGASKGGLPNPNANTAIPNILDYFVFPISASLALLMVVIGGFKYITANGDPNSVTSAKNTIIYALIGLLVVMAAFSIVTFVVKGVG